MSQKILAVIGAGPKGLAIAVKNMVLSEFGFDVPHIVLIEKNEIASHWTGKNGYTNGKMELGTGPEKDVGFPYDTRDFSDEINRAVNARMMSFSWNHYLVETGRFSDFIDRGRPTPVHAQYAQYLSWVAEQLKAHVTIVYGQVVKLGLNGDQDWMIHYRTKMGEYTLEAQGLMLTGPGVPKANFLIEGQGRILDIEGFWKQAHKMSLKGGDRIAIVGTGENSASIANMLGTMNAQLHIDIISPSGFLFSRGESYFENRVYSDAQIGNWDMLSDEDKLNFIKRTDLGVFGQYIQGLLRRRDDIHIVPGRVVGAQAFGEQGVNLNISYNDQKCEVKYDYVILATGFDQLKLLNDVLDEAAKSELSNQLGIECLNQEHLIPLIGSDMAVEGLGPKLHLPMLSRLRQGPGFANLSCLGRLSDRVLASYATLKSERMFPAHASENLEVLAC